MLFIEALYESAVVPRRAWIQFLTILLLGASVFTRKSFRLPEKLFSSVILILISFACSFFFAVDQASSLLRLIEWGTLLLLCCIIACTAGPRQIFWILWGSSFAATLVSCIGMAQFFWNWDFYPQTIAPASTFFNKNFAAEYLVTVLPASFFLIFRSDQKIRLLQTVAFFLQFIYLIMTRSRASWLGFGIAVVLFLQSRYRLREGASLLKSRRGKTVAFCFFVGVIILFFFNASRITHDLGKLDSVRQRLVLWTNSLAMGAEHPFFGVGLGNFYALYPLYHQRILTDTTFKLEQEPYETHNDLYQIALECGLLGFLVFFIFLFQLFRLGKKSAFDTNATSENATSTRASVFGIVALIINSFFSFPLRNPTSAMMFWVWVGVLFSQSSEFTIKKIKTIPLLRILVFAGLTGSIFFSTLSFLGDYHLKRAKLASYQQLRLPALTHIFLAETYFPWDSQIWRERSVIQTRFSTDWKKNVLVLESIRKKDPYYLNNLINLALAYRKTQQYTQSRETYETVLQIRPEEFHSLLGMGLLFWEQNDLEQANLWIKKAQEQSPQDPILLRFLETTLQKEKRE
ncbi:MAG: O-antigen ligase family protein [Planctomycetota bacterium]